MSKISTSLGKHSLFVTYPCLASLAHEKEIARRAIKQDYEPDRDSELGLVQATNRRILITNTHVAREDDSLSSLSAIQI